MFALLPVIFSSIEKLQVMRFVFTILFVVLFYGYGHAQRAGARLYTGITNQWNSSKKVTPSGVHQGIFLGLDARLTSNNPSFIVGVQFARTPMKSFKNIHYFSKNDKIDYLKGRIGFDFYIYSINDYFKIRGKLLGSAYKVFDYDTPALLSLGNGKIIETMISGVVGLGIDYNWLTIDIEYDHGLNDAYIDLDENTRFKNIALMIGFHF